MKIVRRQRSVGPIYIHHSDEDLMMYAGRHRRCERSCLCSQGKFAPLRHLLDLTRSCQANCNRLLDVARETYKENVGDIYQLNRNISESHSLPISLQYQDTGFVFTLKKTDLEGELPKGFVNISLKKGKWVFSSMELVNFIYGLFRKRLINILSPLKKKMNARMKDALDETLILSEKLRTFFLRI